MGKRLAFIGITFVLLSLVTDQLFAAATSKPDCGRTRTVRVRKRVGVIRPRRFSLGWVPVCSYLTR